MKYKRTILSSGYLLGSGFLAGPFLCYQIDEHVFESNLYGFKSKQVPSLLHHGTASWALRSLPAADSTIRVACPLVGPGRGVL